MKAAIVGHCKEVRSSIEEGMDGVNVGEEGLDKEREARSVTSIPRKSSPFLLVHT